MSHYLKLILDAIFGPSMYANEIIWSYGGRGAKAVAKQFPRNHDVIFFYRKTASVSYDKQYERRVFTNDQARAKGFRQDEKNRWFKTAPRGDYSDASIARLDAEERIHWTRNGTARVKYFLDEEDGAVVEQALVGDVWTDIPDAMHMGAERLGYPTQKPLSLLKRIIQASSKPGDIVLDPFCGCGTAVDAAQALGRQWIGIDITFIAVDLIEKRIVAKYAEEVDGTYVVSGIPHDKAAAYALFRKDAFDFERWAVSMVGAQPNARKDQVGDKGIDGVARFPLGPKNETGKVIVSVKGGKNLNPSMVRDLAGTVEAQKAQMGVLITLSDPTKGMVDAVNHAGSYTHPSNGQTYNKIQIITVPELLSGKRVDLPPTYLPYISAQQAKPASTSVSLF